MSAGKKLRALLEAWDGPQTYGPESLEQAEVEATLVNALPQIVAVVEAAEAVNHGSAGWPLMLQQLPVRLTALEEALS